MITIPALTRDQRYYLGKLIWRNIDGVAENVNRLMEAINHDPNAAVRVVATQEWERVATVMQSLRELVGYLDANPSQLTGDHVLTKVRELANLDDLCHPSLDMQVESS